MRARPAMDGSYCTFLRHAHGVVRRAWNFKLRHVAWFAHAESVVLASRRVRRRFEQDTLTVGSAQLFAWRFLQAKEDYDEKWR